MSQHVTRRQVFSYAFALSAALPLATCSTSSKPASQESVSTESASASASSGSNFRFAHAAQVTTLDVGQSASLETRRVSQQILDTLVQSNPDTGAPQAGLAESWDQDEKGTTITFTLRNDVTFHDGTAFDAQTVVDNYKRWNLLAAQESTSASYPYRTLFVASSSAKNARALVTSVKASEQKITFTLSRPSSLFLPSLTQAAFGIVKSGTWDEQGKITDNIIGTGAFSLKSWADGVAVLSANTSYWGQKPSIDSITFSSISSADKRYYALMNDEIDAYDQVDKNDFVPLAKEGVITQTRDPYALVSINLNLEHPVLSNVFVRRAIAHALNRGGITGAGFPQGSYDARSFIPKSLQISDDDLGNYFSGNQDIAKALLMRSGYQNEPVTFYYPTGTNLTALPHPEAVYASIAASLGNIGLNIKPMPIAYTDGYYEKIATSDKDRGISLIEFFGAYHDPMAFVEQVMGSLPSGFFDSKLSTTQLEAVKTSTTSTATPTPTNSADTFDPASVDVPELDSTPLPATFPATLLQSIEVADQPANTDEARTKYIDMLKLWCQLMPAVPLTFAVSALAQGKKVTYLSVSSSGISIFNRVTMSK